MAMSQIVFGKAELRGVEWLWIRYRQAIIQRALSREIDHLKRGTDRMLDDLVAFTQQDIYGWNLMWWSGGLLIDQVRLGLGHEVVRALHRAPTTLVMHALDRIHFENLSEQLVDVMAQVTEGWCKCTNKIDSFASHPSSLVVSRIFTYAVMFASDELQLYKRLRGSVQINYYTLYRFAAYVFPDGNVASRMLQRLEYLLGSDHPYYIGVVYLMRGNHLRHGMDGDALRRRALSMCVRMHRLHAYTPQEDYEDPWPEDLVLQLAWLLGHQGRGVEEEVFRRFYIAVKAHTYQVPNRTKYLKYAFWRLEEILHEQGRHSEADQCGRFDEPLRAIHMSPTNTSLRKAGRLSRIRRLCRMRRSHNEAPRNEEESQIEYLEQLFAEFNPQNDAFLRNIAAGLDEEAQEYFWELTEAKRSSGVDDFYTAHDCSSDCEHDRESEEEGAEDDEETQDEVEGMDEEALKNDAVNAVERADAEATDDGVEEAHQPGVTRN